MNSPLRVAIIGGGTVGGGVVKILQQHPERLQQRCGKAIQLQQVVVRDLEKERPDIPREFLTDQISPTIQRSDVDLIVELIGGTTIAKQVVLQALQAGKDVVTANKALLAEHGPELFETARRMGRTIAFEASVAGGVPIIATLGQSLGANQITAIQGILNGTSNFILSNMSECGSSYADTLKLAQQLGYAEADPTLDVDGSDAAHKLAILVQLAFGVTVRLGDIERQGISDLNAMDLRFAAELGYTIKLLAEAWSDGNQVAVHVAPVLLRRTDMLAQVRGAQNAIQLVGDAVGEVMLQGQGAGAMPTASAVVADILDLAIGRAQATFQAQNLWSKQDRGYFLCPSDNVRSRFYLRVLVHDQPGRLADVARALADHQISIASLIQHEALEEHQGSVVPLVIMTHYAETKRFLKALAKINTLPGVVPPGVYFSVDD
ncbi:MAG: homoserine dehydrogenase [Zavarzinella sp.]